MTQRKPLKALKFKNKLSKNKRRITHHIEVMKSIHFTREVAFLLAFWKYKSLPSGSISGILLSSKSLNRSAPCQAQIPLVNIRSIRLYTSKTCKQLLIQRETPNKNKINLILTMNSMPCVKFGQRKS